MGTNQPNSNQIKSRPHTNMIKSNHASGKKAQNQIKSNRDLIWFDFSNHENQINFWLGHFLPYKKEIIPEYSISERSFARFVHFC